jgi:branched-subunit amino acid aminotransferase/4-amino-4-deoxychorismate lyase
MPVEEREVKLEELWESEEIFITGTSKHVAPVIEIEGRKIGNGKTGVITESISAAYERFFGMQ